MHVQAAYALDPMNVTGSVYDIGIWTALEPLLGIINACLPLLRPVVKACFASLNKRIQPAAVPVVQEGQQPRAAEPTTSVSNRLFSRLYDHIYPLTQSVGLDAEATRLASPDGEEALKTGSTCS